MKERPAVIPDWGLAVEGKPRQLSDTWKSPRLVCPIHGIDLQATRNPKKHFCKECGAVYGP